ncbi:hydantoinase B/oxoprolinase family protein [Haloferula chungangensis]|uniref:Hydantoinase B/oxoprolinase family protein n=1 Tax=Haloferula chungangensis TaxID=1048331 RepID=A0ABW2L7I9_9BACT
MMEEGFWKVRVDTGGTFTDAWCRTPEGEERRCKVLSDGRMRVRLKSDGDGWWKLEDELPDGLLTGWRASDGGTVAEHEEGRLRIEGGFGAEVLELDGGEEAPVVAARLLTRTSPGQELPAMDFRVATTRGTNALLERKGARLALFVTHGFEDLLLIRDQRREELFSLDQPPCEPLAERVVGVGSRMTSDGKELLDLNEEELRSSAREALAAGCTVAAVALLHAWKSPDHEMRVACWLKEEGFEQVTLSSVVAPLIRLLPRAETAVTDAFLAPVMRHFIRRVSEPLTSSKTWLMTSAGGLAPADRYHPKDSLLSGPAGGLIGAAELGKAAGCPKLLTFDMGGTSTDVARIDGPFSYREEQQIGPARVVAPSLKIETVAAGGGSICRWHDGQLKVGPESAGSDPGPACYGRGGPLTLTDVNLLLGLMDTGMAGIPLDLPAAQARFDELLSAMRANGQVVENEQALLSGIRAIAVETMAEAIRSVSVREGVPIGDHTLLAFGGAGPQHACAIAERLGVTKVLVPADAGLLSAWGLERAVRQEQGVRQVLINLYDVAVTLNEIWKELVDETLMALNVDRPKIRKVAGLRLLGQDSTIEVACDERGVEGMKMDFVEAYRRIFGYAPPEAKQIELVSLRVIAEDQSVLLESETFSGEEQEGPALFQDRFSTCVVPEGWSMSRGTRGTLSLHRRHAVSEEGELLSAAVRSGIFRSRFEGMLSAMGEALRRTALSTNVKERLDFSCALLDAKGRLVASAPHVPVHLGALGVCVRETVARLKLEPGDVAITNHPAAGGSHLPDVTLIAPIHDEGGELIGYVANRAHHAELGGKAPGSMPADASCLAEEGVVISPMHLVKAGHPRMEELERLLKEAPFPSRRPADNLADVEAQLASCHLGRQMILRLVEAHGAETVRDELAGIIDHSSALMRSRLSDRRLSRKVETLLDDGAALMVSVEVWDGRAKIDFSGSAPVHPRNLNATPAIVRSVTLFVLRLWLGDDVPLNEGLLEPLDIVIPPGMLNPGFSDDPSKAPAVVGGNVEISQRLTDILLEAFGLAANGPGTMNNFLFGDETFGYYETLAGGSGAGPGFHGSSGRHVHMTNTALTDPEVIEHRYPVRVWRHEIRKGSGGNGEFKGGNGITREIEFLRPLTVSFLTQRRRKGPRGSENGGDGASGRQTRVKPNGSKDVLPASVTYRAAAGERVIIETPGGGAWGKPG